MKLKLITLLFILPLFVQATDTINKIIVIDTLAIDLYEKYQIDPASKQKNGSYSMSYKGKTLTQGNFKNDKRNGEWNFIGTNDTLQQKGIYSNGMKEGTWEAYYSNGALSCTMPYKNGKKNGLFKGFYINGTVSFEIPYTDNNISGISSHYYKNGKIFSEEIYQGDTLNGISKEYYENGVLKIKKYMKGKNIDSVYLSYYDNGSLWGHLVYKNGTIYNVVSYLARDGKPLNSGTLKDGTGTMRFYDLEGTIKSEETYTNLLLDGHAKYSKKGILISEGDFNKGKTEGLWIKNYPSGELNSKINYKNGKKEGEGLYYHKNGKILQKGLFANDARTGLWITYDENGGIVSELNYINDLLDGDAKYYEEGKLSREGKYESDTKIYIWTNYNGRGKVRSEEDYGYKVSGNEATKTSPPPPPPFNSSREKSETVFSMTEQMPSFPGGYNMMSEFIQKNIIYPQIEKEAGIQGTAYVTFVVDNLGEIHDVNILRGVTGGPGCDREAKRIIEIMPRWDPGMQNGRPVNVQFNLPIKYRLR